MMFLLLQTTCLPILVLVWWIQWVQYLKEAKRWCIFLSPHELLLNSGTNEDSPHGSPIFLTIKGYRTKIKNKT